MKIDFISLAVGVFPAFSSRRRLFYLAFVLVQSAGQHHHLPPTTHHLPPLPVLGRTFMKAQLAFTFFGFHSGFGCLVAKCRMYIMPVD